MINFMVGLDMDTDNKKLASSVSITSNKNKSDNKNKKEKLASALRDNLRRRKVTTPQNNKE